MDFYKIFVTFVHRQASLCHKLEIFPRFDGKTRMERVKFFFGVKMKDPRNG